MLIRHLVVFLSSLFFGLSVSAVSAEEDGPPVRRIVILETSDIHSHIGTGGKEGDWLILAGLISRARKEAGGADNSLLVDCGDTLSGTLLGAVSAGAASVEVLNALGYDAWIPGNHDFEFGRKRLRELWGGIRAARLAANLESPTAETADWRIFRKNGVRVAVVGMTSPYLPRWLWGSRMDGFVLKEVFETLDRVMPEVRAAKPDMTILAIHQGRFPPKRLGGVALSAIAERYPQIDLILGGHSHSLVPGERLGRSGVWYVEPGGHGVALGWIEAEVDVARHLVVNIRSRLIPVSGRKPDWSPFPKDSKLKLEKWIAATKRRARRGIGCLPDGVSALDALLAGMEKVAGADAAFGRIPGDASALSGNVSGKDLFDAVPYSDTVCVLEMGREDVLAVISEQLAVAKSEASALRWRGVVMKRSSDGTPRLFLPNGREWRAGAEKRLKVAFSSYDLASAGGRYPKLAEIAKRPDCHGGDTGVGLRTALAGILSHP